MDKRGRTRLLDFGLAKLSHDSQLHPQGASSDELLPTLAEDRAFECLERTYQERGGTLFWLKVNPLHDDPRFDSLLQRLGLADWSNIFSVATGAQYQLNSAMFLRAGYQLQRHAD